jgi:GxxExxY protein
MSRSPQSSNGSFGVSSELESPSTENLAQDSSSPCTDVLSASNYDIENFNVEEQKSILIQYRGEPVCRHRLDLLVENAVVVEVKAVRRLKRIHQAQILSYLKASGCRVGLLMNFNVTLFVKGLRRFVR